MATRCYQLTAALFLSLALSASATTRYVDVNSTHAAPPFLDWGTAATNIQDAVDAAVAGDEILVTNGIYATGGRVAVGALTNRVAVDRPLTLRSVNGPLFTIIQGYQVPGTTNDEGAIRCVYLINGARLDGFTLTNGATRPGGNVSPDQSGGGVSCESAFAVISNCVLTGNSAAYGGGGSFQGTLVNCTFINNSAGFGGGGTSFSTLTNCTLNSNWAGSEGGGSFNGTLNNCTLSSNSVVGGSTGGGGGSYGGTLNNCKLMVNWSAGYGGGARNSKLNGCSVTGSWALYGGGVANGVLRNCALNGNSALNGGGVLGSTLTNCTITGNWAINYSGGAGSYGGGVSKLYNCIIYFNNASDYPNYDPTNEVYFCCTPLLPIPSGCCNINLDPQLASASHLSASSPCRGAGNAGFSSGTDIDGEAWANPPSIGCDEYYVGVAAGPLSAGIGTSFTNLATGYSVALTAIIDGWTTSSVWDFGDGVTISNRPFASHAWTTAGDYAVVLRVYNESYSLGVTATVTVHVVTQPVHYVASASVNPLSPYSSWATAATNIQDAVDAVTVPGALVLVTNGIYATGGRAVGTNIIVNRVAVDKPLILQSVSGPQFTIIQGYQVPLTINGDGAIRCVYLAGGASLFGFTLANGATRTNGDTALEKSGGGLFCVDTSLVASNCLLVGNSAASYGGGVYGGTLTSCTLLTNSASQYGGGGFHVTLNDCTLSGNSASFGGGEAFATLNNCTLRGNLALLFGGGGFCGTLNFCLLTGNTAKSGGGSYGADDPKTSTLNNCLVTGNWAGFGAGAFSGTLNNCTITGNWATNNGGGVNNFVTLNNCIVYYNTALVSGSNFVGVCTFNYSCTAPRPTVGFGSITNAPLFVDYDGGNLRLQSNSTCINAGTNAYAVTTIDFDGNPRIVGGTIDMGAYECQSPTLLNYYAWLQGFGLPTTASAVYADSDSDGLNNWQEWRADTIPTNALSVLRMVTVTTGTPGLRVTWQSVPTRTYWLDLATNLALLPAFSVVASNIVGQAVTTTYADTTATNGGQFFYRVGVQQ